MHESALDLAFISWGGSAHAGDLLPNCNIPVEVGPEIILHGSARIGYYLAG